MSQSLIHTLTPGQSAPGQSVPGGPGFAVQSVIVRNSGEAYVTEPASSFSYNLAEPPIWQCSSLSGASLWQR